MNRTVASTRIAVSGMVLMGLALGMFGDIKFAATTPIFPRPPQTEQEQRVAYAGNSAELPGAMNDVRLFVRVRSGEGDPCVPTAPVSFGTGMSVIC